jgi:hypothetical protein
MGKRGGLRSPLVPFCSPGKRGGLRRGVERFPLRTAKTASVRLTGRAREGPRPPAGEAFRGSGIVIQRKRGSKGLNRLTGSFPVHETIEGRKDREGRKRKRVNIERSGTLIGTKYQNNGRSEFNQRTLFLYSLLTNSSKANQGIVKFFLRVRERFTLCIFRFVRKSAIPLGSAPLGSSRFLGNKSTKAF